MSPLLLLGISALGLWFVSRTQQPAPAPPPPPAPTPLVPQPPPPTPPPQGTAQYVDVDLRQVVAARASAMLGDVVRMTLPIPSAVADLQNARWLMHLPNGDYITPVAESPQGTLHVLPANDRGSGVITFYLATQNPDGTYKRTNIFEMLSLTVH